MKTLRIHFIYYIVFSIFFSLSSLAKDEDKELNNAVAMKWAKTTLDFTYMQLNKSPTFISRVLAYTGIAMYESVVHGSSKYQSIAKQLNGLEQLPMPETGKQYDWELVLNASQPRILRLLWQPEKSEYGIYSIEKIDSLETAILVQKTIELNDSAVVNRSVRYGKALANAIFEWSKTDGGHEMNFKSFDSNYTYPKGTGYWVPPVGGQSPIMMPLHPYWGKNRQFLKTNSELPVAKMIPYSADSTSAYYQQFKQVYDIQKKLTQQQKETANWWGDDPAYTTAPPGHSFRLAITLLKTNEKDLVTTAMTFAKVGMACGEAFINCWKNKYTYHAERPMQYIRNNIDKRFVQFWPEPPFPGFPSGHSTQMSATAEVLISIFGNKIHFTDDTYAGKLKNNLRNVAYTVRSFDKISDMAEECGISRLYGGIHTMQDNLVGMDEGKKIGKNINRIKWKK